MISAIAVNNFRQKETKLFSTVCMIQRFMGSQESQIVIHDGIGYKIYCKCLIFTQMSHIRIKNLFHSGENCGCDEFLDKVRLGNRDNPEIELSIKIQ